MKKMATIISLLALAITPALAFSKSTDGNQNGVYVGGAWGQFDLHLKNLSDVDTAVSSVAHSNNDAWKAYVGARFSPYWGMEVAYVDFGRAGDRFEATGSNGNYRVKMSGFSPSLIGTIPLGPVELFAKGGYYFYNVDTRIDLDSGGHIESRHSRTDFLYGGGVGVTAFDHLNFRAEYERINIRNATDSDAFWLGAAWRF